MKLILFGLLGAIVLISGANTNFADAKEMKHVPFWWSTDSLTGERVYTDYFKQSSSVLQEHNAYLQSSLIQNESTFSPLIKTAIERAGLIEVITEEWQWITVRESVNDHGPFANPDYTIREKVQVSNWVPAPTVVPDTPIVPETDDVISYVMPEQRDVTPETVTEVTPDVTEPVRVSNMKDNTHWDSEERHIIGHDKMSPQELKDLKKKKEAYKAYELASQLMPDLYPPHDYKHTYDKVESNIIEIPSQTNDNTVVIPVPEPVPENNTDDILVPLN